MSEAGRRPLVVRRLGVMDYAEALSVQELLVQKRRAGSIEDQLLLLEHPPVITLGSGSDDSHVLVGREERESRGVSFFETGRGGDVTYHGPGQLVGYPILDLKPDRQDLHRYLRDLEGVLIRVLGDFGLDGRRVDGYTGVWVSDQKVAAIGVRVSSGWITSHGFALNVATDLTCFSMIVPCGLHDRQVTSITELLGYPVEVEVVARSTRKHFAELFGREIRVGPATLELPG